MALPKDTRPYGVERAAMIENRRRQHEASSHEVSMGPEKRSRHIGIMIKESEYKKLRRLAAENDKTLSSYIAKILSDHLKKLQS